jgi:hypothetical protein
MAGNMTEAVECLPKQVQGPEFKLQYCQKKHPPNKSKL